MNFLDNTIWLFFLTVALYALGLFLTEKRRWILFNPIILSSAILIAYLVVFKIPYEKYQAAGQHIDFLLKPSIVAMAIPLYLQWDTIKKQFGAILISQLVGCVVGLFSVVILAKLMGAENDIIMSLAPKSVSTPIALEISSAVGGIPSITAAAVILTGLMGSVAGYQLLNLARITNPVSQSIAMGTASHAMGTMRALEFGDKHGAFASVGMIFNGILTAFLAPYILLFLKPYL